MYGSDMEATLPVTPEVLRTSARWLVYCLIFLVLALPLTPWQQTISGSGRVVAFAPADREQAIEAPIKGRIVGWLVIEGQTVQQGQPLVELMDVDPDFVQRLEAQRAAARGRMLAAEGEVNAYEAQAKALEGVRQRSVRAAQLKVEMAKQTVEAAQQSLEAEEANLHTAKLNHQRQKELITEGLVSQRDLELAELAFNRARADVDRAKAALSEARSLQMSLEAEQLQRDSEALAAIASAKASARKADAARANAENDVVRIESELSRQQSRVVRAPRHGTILNVVGSEGGKMVSVGELLGVLVPRTESRAVELWLSGNDAPLATEGRKVRLQFEGWPAVQFSGWPQVAVGTFGGEVAVVDAASRQNGRFRALVIPDAEDDPWPHGDFLRQGVRAKGWVLLDQVSLGFEVWRRLNGFPPALGEQHLFQAKDDAS